MGERAREEFERQQKEKDRILRRIANKGLREQGQAIRQLKVFAEAMAEAERQKAFKHRGILRRMVDSNVRLMSAGWNKLLEAHKARNGMLMEKLRFVIKTLTDKDAQFTLMAYNQMKQRMLMLNGVGLGDAEMKKCQLIKRLTNQGHNLQVMGVNCIREFLTSARDDEVRAQEEFERQQKEKDRIMRRIVDSNVRLMSAGWNKLLEAHKARNGALKE